MATEQEFRDRLAGFERRLEAVEGRMSEHASQLAVSKETAARLLAGQERMEKGLEKQNQELDSWQATTTRLLITAVVILAGALIGAIVTISQLSGG